GVVLGFGVVGVYLGIVAGNILGGIVGFLWARVFIGRLLKVYGPAPVQEPQLYPAGEEELYAPVEEEMQGAHE
ncbi:MAG TPA: hypothetical protein VE134_08745, partial [Methanomicrobiales archaeon]|nr:hypothetical protein [Methanomicrobiales archaeon]